MAIVVRQLVALVLVVLLVSPASADEAAAIRARLDAWTEAFNRGDGTAACELFSRTLISQFRGQAETGYEQRCQAITRALEDRSRTYRNAFDLHEIIVQGDLAVVRLTWRMTIQPGDLVSVEPGMDVFRKEADGQWRIIRYLAYAED
jgi:uncharacterized protein (TIGR02246 family)